MSRTTQLVEDLRMAVLPALNEVASFLAGDIDSIDLARVRLESIIESVYSVSEHVQIDWSPEVVTLLQDAVNELNHVVDNDQDVRNVGRPKFFVPIHSIENLLSMNFTVPSIARMFGVSKDTICRRMREN